MALRCFGLHVLASGAPMSILPVIDLKDGVVVRGVAGLRDAYQPVKSVLAAEASPATVAAALGKNRRFRDVYVADLNAIEGQSPAWDDYAAIIKTGLRLWVDAGVDGLPRAIELANWNHSGVAIDRIILAMETLPDGDALQRIVDVIAPERLVFSLDLKDGCPLAASADWRQANPLSIARQVVDCGINRLILLDLAHVGVGQGTGTDSLCREIRQNCPNVELIVGGGVGSRSEVEARCADGASRVLVCSALHDGRIT